MSPAPQVTPLTVLLSLMHGIADGLMQRLQAIQNAAARLITGARRRDHISPDLRQLHWLPVRANEFSSSWPCWCSKGCMGKPRSA